MLSLLEAVLNKSTVPGGINNKEAESAHLLVISDSIVRDGSFFLSLFLSRLLKTGRRVCFVSFSQIFGHYSLIGRKMGMNLEGARAKKELNFIEFMSNLSKYYRSNSNGRSLEEKKSFEHPLQSLFSEIYSSLMEQIAQNARPVLMFDDISVLLHSGINPSEVIKFLHNCISLITRLNGHAFVQIHNDSVFPCDHSTNIIFHYLATRSSILIKVNPLESGSREDIHGDVHIAKGPHLKSSKFIPQRLHFCIHEGGVNFFARGT